MAIQRFPEPNPEMINDLKNMEIMKKDILKSFIIGSADMGKHTDDLVTILSGIGSVIPETMTPRLPLKPMPMPIGSQQGIAGDYDSDEVQRKLKEAQMEAENHSRADALLRDRLLGIRGRFDLAQHEMLLAHVHHDTVYVFYVFEGGKAGHLTDPIDLFPSDELVTQLRLLRNA